jgi:toxin ParE1/3/4
VVKWTAHALAQLRHIHDYIAQDSPLYAKRVAEALVRKTIGLDELPRIGRMVPELSEDTVREISLYSYRILYEIKPASVEVLAVVHKRRDLPLDEISREK